MEEDDLPMVLAWRNHPAIRAFMLTQHEINLEEHRKWFERVKVDNTRHQLIVMDGTVPLGFVQLNSVRHGGIADWGFYVRPGAQKGSGKKLGHAALMHSFNIIGLHKVCGKAIESNLASISFHQRMGFQEEGRLREQQCIDDRYHTIVCFGLLAREWQETVRRKIDPYATN